MFEFTFDFMLHAMYVINYMPDIVEEWSYIC